jgi:hypothetical protein
VLDSTQPKGDDGYVARLDDEQFEWLEGDLAAVEARATGGAKSPVCVLSHIPIASAGALFIVKVNESGDYRVSGSLMHQDAQRIKNLFAKHVNVKLCLSGHTHLVDRIDYLGVAYLGNGAVSGAWWKGKNHEFAEGYALIDLYEDGTFDHEYVTYGWQAG